MLNRQCNRVCPATEVEMMDDDQIIQRADEIIGRHQGREGPMLPILHDIQAEFGYVPECVIPKLADALNIGRAEVHGVISFYHDFRKNPAGEHVIKICRAEACQAVGANDLSKTILSQLGIEWGETTADGKVTVEPVYCLGLCACGPAAMVDNTVIGRLDENRVDALLKEVRS